MADIKISELSIGDWVRHTFYEDNLQIKRIDGESERLLAEKGLMSVSCHLDHFEPISLTPEILEKNGFVKGEIYEGNSSIVFTNGNIRISWFKNAMWCRLRIYNALGDIELCSAIVHNVHQLQHALRLAGVGKEIVL